MDDKKDETQYYLPVHDDIEIMDSKHGVIMTSPNGTKYRLTVSNAGASVWTAL